MMRVLWFQVPYMVMVGGGFLMSGYFLITWWRGVTNKRSLEAFDAGGWVLLMVLALGLVMVNGLIYGLPEPPSVSRGIQGLVIYTVLDSVLIVRMVVWHRIRRQTRTKKVRP